MTDLQRRNVLAGLAAAGVAAPVLAACGGDEPSGASTGASSPADAPSATTSGSSPGGAGGGGISTDEIPVGGGKIFAKEKVVVTQPTAGEFKAFSAVCPHQGCILSEVEGGTVDCGACHGSKFSIADGSVEQGPATQGLAEKDVTVTGTSLTVS